MIEYIYFVKCPDCEDEHFDFFDKAKGFALGCLSKKPIITQVEVNRNDFGECTDSFDHGMIWSWEDECKECDSDVEQEKAGSHILTKADLENIPEHDPEFDELDNSVEVKEDDDFFFVNQDKLSEDLKSIVFGNDKVSKEILRLCNFMGINTAADLEHFVTQYNNIKGPITKEELLDLLLDHRLELGDTYEGPVNDRKPIPEGMTIEQLVEEMEENEDEVECTWCNELFPKDQCRYEVDLGYLCSRCEAAIKSRGETLTFRENNYWDFLNEDVETSENSESEELEVSPASKIRLATCPECGAENAFDHDTGVCNNCGFII